MFADKNGLLYAGEMRPGDRVATAPEEAAFVAAVNAALAMQSIDLTALNDAKADGTVAYLINHTAAECYNKVQTDVTDLASAKVMIGRLAMAIAALVRFHFR